MKRHNIQDDDNKRKQLLLEQDVDDQDDQRQGGAPGQFQRRAAIVVDQQRPDHQKRLQTLGHVRPPEERVPHEPQLQTIPCKLGKSKQFFPLSRIDQDDQ